MNHIRTSTEEKGWSRHASPDTRKGVRPLPWAGVPPCGQDGAALVTALLAMLILSAVGIMITVTVAEDMQVASNHYEIASCLYISEAGLNYAIKKIQSSPAWGGLAEPGRQLSSGRFIVAVSDSSNGMPLPMGQKRINITARQGTTEREIEVIVQ